MTNCVHPILRLPAAIGLLTAVYLVCWSPPAAAEAPRLPRSLAEAVRKEHDDALPRTAFYETPSLAATELPIPREAPVITATFPSNEKFGRGM